MNSKEQIIFAGRVINSNDPAMLGRIRAVPISEDQQGIARSVDPLSYDDIPPKLQWGEKDRFMFTPLLPFFISQRPKDQEYVHLIYASKELKGKSQFYIQGPYTSPMNTNQELYATVSNYVLTNQIPDTYYQLKNKIGGFLSDPNSTKGIFPEPNDVGLLGRGSSDVILKRDASVGEDSVLIRSGKYKGVLLDPKQMPQLNNFRSFLQISNFLQTRQENPKKTVFFLQNQIKFVKYLVEWDIWNLNNPPINDSYTGTIHLYTITESPNADTETFKLFTNIDESSDILIFKIQFFGQPFNTVVNLINKFILEVNNKYLNFTSPYNASLELRDEPFPFVFRPGPMTRKYLLAPLLTDPAFTLERENINRFINDIKLPGNDQKGCVIVYSDLSTNKGSDFKPLFEDVNPSEYISSPTSFAVLGSDTLYLLSHKSDAIPGKEKIDLSGTLYGIPQDKFENIKSNTNAMVRGEELIKLLDMIVKFLAGHSHAFIGVPPTPVSYDGTAINAILAKLYTAKTEILNQNIRIN